MEYYTGRHYTPVSPSQFTMSAKSKLAICDFSKIKIWLLGTKMVYFIPNYPAVTGFKTDTLAKLFGLQNRTPVFDKITILLKARYHHYIFLIIKLLSSNQAYRIYSFNCPVRLLNFWTLKVGAYLRLGAY